MPVAAQCPFYRYEKNKITYCEYADLHPPDKRARDEVIFQLCAHDEAYKSCPFYKAMDNYYHRKYEREENTLACCSNERSS